MSPKWRPERGFSRARVLQSCALGGAVAALLLAGLCLRGQEAAADDCWVEVQGDAAPSASSVCVSPDGALVAAAANGRAYLWDRSEGYLLRTLQRPWALASVAFSPDGEWLAAGGGYELALWRVADGGLAKCVRAQEFGVSCVEFAPDGSLVACNDGSTVRLVHPSTEGEPAALSGHSGRVTALSFAPDGAHLATGDEGGTVRLWDVGAGEVRQLLDGLGGPVTCLRCSPDGSMVAVGVEGSVVLWAPAEGNRIQRRTGVGLPVADFAYRVNDIAFSPDGTELATVQNDNVLRVWDVATMGRDDLAPALLRPGPVGLIDFGAVYEGDLASVEYAPDGQRLLTAGPGGVVSWNQALQAERQYCVPAWNPVTCLSVSADGARLAAVANERELCVWDMVAGTPVLSTDCGDGMASVVYLSPDGSQVALVGDWDAPGVRLLNVLEQGQPVPLEGADALAHARLLGFAADGAVLGALAEDGVLVLWDTRSGSVRCRLAPQGAAAIAAALSADGSMAAVGQADGTVTVWRTGDGAAVAAMSGPPVRDPCMRLAFSADGSLLASSADHEHGVRVWDVAESRLLHVALEDGGWADGRPQDVAFGHADGRLLYFRGWGVLARHDPTGTQQDDRIDLGAPASWFVHGPGSLLLLPDEGLLLSLGTPDQRVLVRAIGGNQWVIIGPHGYCIPSPGAHDRLRVTVGTASYLFSRFAQVLTRPDMIGRALQGEAIPTPDIQP